MNIKIGEYRIKTDEREFTVMKTWINDVKDSKDYGKECYKNVAHCTNFKSALSFIPEHFLRTNDYVL